MYSILVSYLRNELELVSRPPSAASSRTNAVRRLSDPDAIRHYACERDFDGIFYRKLKNNEEIAEDHELLGQQNKNKVCYYC